MKNAFANPSSMYLGMSEWSSFVRRFTWNSNIPMASMALEKRGSPSTVLATMAPFLARRARATPSALLVIPVFLARE